MKRLDDYQTDPHNANRGTERGRGMLEQSIRKYGAGRSILVDRNGVAIAGNKTLEVAAELGLDVLEVETDGNQLVVVRRTDLDLSEAPARELAYADNRVAQVDLEFDPAVIAEDLRAGVDLSGMWVPEELARLAGITTEAKAERDGQELDLTRADVPDAIFPTNNEWGIPVLDVRMQATTLVAPALIWGEISRTARMRGMWMFYTGDERFEALWADPTPVINSGCVSAVEPNFSCYDQMSRAFMLFQTYRKRWIARFWQSQGIRIWVDLNVAENGADLNLLGVPQGWKAWATRGYTERMDATEREYVLAVERAGGEDGLLFLVYGGGKVVRDLCWSRGWLWIDERQNKKDAAGVMDG